MRHLTARLGIAGIALSCALPHTAWAQEGDARAALEATLVNAVACKAEFGADWDPIVNDALSNLETFLTEEDPDIAKVDLDVILAELLADGKELPMTDALKDHCRTVMASGS